MLATNYKASATKSFCVRVCVRSGGGGSIRTCIKLSISKDQPQVIPCARWFFNLVTYIRESKCFKHYIQI